MPKRSIDVTAIDINTLCDMAKSNAHADEESFVEGMREQLLALNRGHQAMYRELRRKR